MRCFQPDTKVAGLRNRVVLFFMSYKSTHSEWLLLLLTAA